MYKLSDLVFKLGNALREDFAKRDDLPFLLDIGAFNFDDFLGGERMGLRPFVFVEIPVQRENVFLKAAFNRVDNRLINQRIERAKPGDGCDGHELGRAIERFVQVLAYILRMFGN